MLSYYTIFVLTVRSDIFYMRKEDRRDVKRAPNKIIPLKRLHKGSLRAITTEITKIHTFEIDQINLAV